MGRALIPPNGEDVVYTPDDLAQIIVDHFKPTGLVLDPCRGNGAFYDLIYPCDWCEITEGRDFLEFKGEYDWIISNPPWSKFRDFLKKGMEVADNIVYLVTTNHWMTTARQREIRENGFGLVELLVLPQPNNSTWPKSGFQLSAGWLRRGWNGSTYFNYKYVTETVV